MRNLLYICLFLLLGSCVSKTEYDKLENERQRLEVENNNLEYKLSTLRYENYQIKSELDKMLEAKQKEENEKSRVKYVSDSEALGYIKDYYSFYQTNKTYRDIKLRRTSKNSFIVSLEEAFTFTDIWSDMIYSLVVNNDKSYNYTRKVF